MAAQRLLTVEIVAPAAPVWRGTAAFVTVPTATGTVGVYPRHQPLLAVLGTGRIRIEDAAGDSVYAEVEGGFVSVDSDVVTIVADSGKMVGE